MNQELSSQEYNDLMAKKQVPRKYGNRKVEIDGVLFDSQAEGNRYWELKQLERKGLIVNLELQPTFPLLVNGVQVAVYKADFRFVDVETDRVTVEDVKGVRTPVYKLKKKMVKAQYGIDVQEIEE